MKLPQKYQNDKVLLTTLWFTATTTMDGKPYYPEPKTSMTSVNVDRQAHLKEEINRYNQWADQQKGRPRVAFTKQQIVTVAVPPTL